jgi:guanylate kinase
MRMLGERSALIPLVTTRDRLPGEHGEYRHVTKEKFQQEIAKKNIAALSHFGEGEQKIWEGYRLSDIEAAWAKGMLPVVTTDVHLLRELSNHFGRRSILSFGLLPPGKSKRAMLSALFRRLRERGKETEQWVGARVERAAEELQALRMNAHLFDHLLINEDAGTVAETVERHMRRFESR